jgi:mitochondrial-processing peptidase subunit alpha
MADKIDAVTAESLQRVALRIFGSHSGGKPTVLAMGSNDFGDWQTQFRKYDVGTV